MTVSSTLSKIILPFISQFQCASLLVAGETASAVCEDLNDTRSYSLATPFSLAQFDNITTIDLAIVSNLAETLSKKQATEWLGLLKNQFTPHIILLVNDEVVKRDDWQLTDYLALGFKHRGTQAGITIFTYAIENYQFKHDWLNNRHWANPENYNKYRW